MDKITAFNRTYTRLVRKAAAEFARDEAIEVSLGDKHALVGTMTALDEQVLTSIFDRCIEHAAKVEAQRAVNINALGVPMWATLARYDAVECVTPMPSEAWVSAEHHPLREQIADMAATAAAKQADEAKEAEATYACGRCGDAGMGASFPHVYEGACFECGRKAPREAGIRPAKPVVPGHWSLVPCEGGCGTAVEWADAICTECMKAHIDELGIAQREHAAYGECYQFDGDDCDTCRNFADDIDAAISSLAAKGAERLARLAEVAA